MLVVNVGPPTFVSFLSHFCPNVSILSCYCPDLVSFLSPSCPLSHFWLFSVYFVLNFVPIWSTFCHCGFSIVPILSSFEPLLYGKSSGQILVITRTELFSHFLPGHPAAGQNVDNIWTTACPIFVAFLSRQLIQSRMWISLYIMVGHYLDICWTKVRLFSKVWLESFQQTRYKLI